MAPDINQLLDTIRRLQTVLDGFGVSQAAKSDSLLVIPEVSSYDFTQRTPDIFRAAAALALIAGRSEVSGPLRDNLIRSSGTVVQAVMQLQQKINMAQRTNEMTKGTLREILEMVVQGSEDPDIRRFIEPQVHQLAISFDRTNSVFEENLNRLLDALNSTLDLNVAVTGAQGTADQKQKALQVKATVSGLLRSDVARRSSNQDLQKYPKTADKRFADAASRTPQDGRNYLESLISWKLSTMAAMGLPALLQKQSNARRLVAIDVKTAVLQAASSPNQDYINQLTQGKQAAKTRVDELSDPILADGEYINSLISVFRKVLLSTNGGPDWDEIAQDHSTSKSDWAWLRTELSALSATSYGSSTLGVEGKSIVDQANKLADELKTYNDKRTDGRVNQIASEVNALKVRASKLSAATSLRSGQVAIPIQLSDSTRPTTDKPEFAASAVQTLSFQIAVISKQIEASQDLYNGVIKNKKAKLDESRDYLNSLDLLKNDTDWNRIQEMLLGLIQRLAEALLQFQELREFTAIAADYSRTMLADSLGKQSAPDGLKLGDVSQSEYNTRTSINHLINLSSLNMTLARILAPIVELLQNTVTPIARISEQGLQMAGISGDMAYRSFEQGKDVADDALDRIGAALDQVQRNSEDDAGELLEALNSRGPASLDSNFSDAVNEAKSDYVTEVSRVLSLV